MAGQWCAKHDEIDIIIEPVVMRRRTFGLAPLHERNQNRAEVCIRREVTIEPVFVNAIDHQNLTRKKAKEGQDDSEERCSTRSPSPTGVGRLSDCTGDRE